MTATPDAFDIANRFLDSGTKRNELEVAILRHMEHHIAVEREACALVADQRAQEEDAMSAVNSAACARGIAAAIRGR